jgi:hypothetical protein
MEQMCRASLILSADRYIGKSFGPATKASLRNSYSPELRSVLATMKQSDWAPRTSLSELLSAIVSVHGHTPQSQKRVTACGRAIAEDAAGTFIRLILRMATPGMFAKKFPDFWQRDFRGGYAEVDASHVAQNRFTMFLKDIEGFDYAAPLGVGFVGFAMERASGKKVTIDLLDWSFDHPGPREVRYEVSW